MSKQTSSNGIGFLGLLTLIFIALKLAGVGVVAAWSWWAVLSPLWIPALIGLGVFALVLVVLVIKDR